VASGLLFHLGQWLDGGNAEHRDATDDIENREINAAKIHDVYPNWAYGGGACRGAEGAF
jgi:hypothetical protein